MAEKDAIGRYEILQHADDLTRYFVRNKQTGKHVVSHVSFKQAMDTMNALEFVRLAAIAERLVREEWPKEIDV